MMREGVRVVKEQKTTDDQSKIISLDGNSKKPRSELTTFALEFACCNRVRPLLFNLIPSFAREFPRKT